MLHIKKIGLIFLLQLFVLVNLKADMLFYYSAAVLPSIVSSNKPRADLSGLWSGEFVSADGTSYPMTAIISHSSEIRIFSLNPQRPWNQTLVKIQMDGSLAFNEGAISSTLNYYYDDDEDGIASLVSTLTISGSSRGDTLSGTFTSVSQSGTFSFTYDNRAVIYDELQFAYYNTSIYDTIGNVLIYDDLDDLHSDEYGSCQYTSGQFASVDDPGDKVFGLSVNYKCGETVTPYEGIFVGSVDDYEYGDASMIFSVSNGATSRVDYISPQY